jgi:nitroreductase
MDVFDAVRTILAVRAYREDPIPDDIVRRITKAGHLSASSMNRQPWHFIVVDDRGALARLGTLTRSGPYIAGAPLAIAVAIEKASQFAVSDASRAVQDMMLVAWEAGVGSNWAGFFGLDEAEAFLGVPEQYTLLAIVPFGYPAAKIGQGKKNRKPLDEVVSRGQFGVPFGSS